MHELEQGFHDSKSMLRQLQDLASLSFAGKASGLERGLRVYMPLMSTRLISSPFMGRTILNSCFSFNELHMRLCIKYPLRFYCINSVLCKFV
ncbi:hypothetical protein LguiB_018100 [Lonicera macranthoides]